MKTRIAFLSIVLTALLSLPMFGQKNEAGKGKTGMKHHEMMSKMGKPTFEETSQGVNFKVWLMTQEEHKEMMGEQKEAMEKDMKMDKDMKGMGDKDMDMDKETKKAMMAGTHHIALFLTDASSGKEISDASARVRIVSPTKNEASVELRTAMTKDHLGGGVSLDEKGVYQFTLNAKIGKATKTIHFNYTVKK